MPENRPYSKNSPSLYEHPQQGFTLVELLVVMLVLVALASITIETSKDFVFQQRYEVTKDRYAKIKKAIIGNPNQVINGQPNIEGFVKDVGRLPFKLEELTNGYCEDNVAYHADEPACTTATKTWNTKTYLSSDKVLKDGWGNDWIVNNPVTNIQSLGKDNLAGGSDYNVDYPATATAINQNDWKVDISLLKVSINTPYNGACSAETCSNPVYTTQADCIAPIPPSIWVIPTSKANCEAGGESWTPTPKPICIRLTHNNVNYVTDSTSLSVQENGREQLISGFNFYQDANDDGIQDAGENILTNTLIPIGKATIAIHTYTISSSTCESAFYNSTLHSDTIDLTMIPNTTLPTINW